MFDVVVAAGFQYVYKPHNVAVDISMRVVQTVTYAGLCSEVAYLVEFFGFEELVYTVAIR